LKNKICSLTATLLVFVVSGCASARFYPVHGPLSEQKPVPVLKGTLTARFVSGSMRIKLPSGEVCAGRWEVVPCKDGKTGNPQSAHATAEMVELWNYVYGHDFYESQVMGTRRYSRGVLTGNAGTTINVEFYQELVDVSDTGQTQIRAIKGIAKDNKGNAYRMSFL
jgi:hypothetical protein